MYKLTRAKNEGKEIDIFNLFILPTLLLRLLYSQLWITLSRFHTANTKHKIVNKSLDFDQVDRERNWQVSFILLFLINFLLLLFFFKFFGLKRSLCAGAGTTR